MSEDTGSAPQSPTSQGEATLAVIAELCVLMRTTSTHTDEHESTRKSAQDLRDRLEAARPPFSLQFAGRAVFRDEVLLPLDVESYDGALLVGRTLYNLDAHEIGFDRVPDMEDVLRFGTALARGMSGGSDALNLLRADGIRWRRIPNLAISGGAPVDPSMFALTQLMLAVYEAQGLPVRTGEPWPWAIGRSVVRRVERALGADSQAACRVMELAPGDWGIPRRAVAAAMNVLLVLRLLGVADSTARIAAHAVLILGFHGLRERGGLPLALAAGTAIPSITHSAPHPRGAGEPHRLRTTAFLHGLVRPGAPGTPCLASLVDLCYELAKARRPEAVPFDLTRLDLLAMASAQAGRRFDAAWVSALVTAYGVLPPGAFARLADGRIGTVMQASDIGDPFRPVVLVDGVFGIPDSPVEPVSPAVVQAGG